MARNKYIALKHDPSSALGASDHLAVRYSYEKDFLGATDIPINDVWQSKPVQSILKKQQPNGFWEYPSGQSAVWSKADYNHYETFRKLADLVEKYRLTKDHPSIPKIADYYFRFLKPEGDIRGIYGNQTSPNYTSAILELLLKAGFTKDKRVKTSIDGLLGLRQNDDGWALALRTRGKNLGAFDLEDTVEPDRTMPSSAMITGVVLRALAAHPDYRDRSETIAAAKIVADSIFTPDKYADRRAAEYWTRFGFPFVYTDLISALDSLSIIGGFQDHPKVVDGMEWIVAKQTKDGLFNLRTTRGNKQEQQFWMALAICRVFKQMYSK